MTDNTSESFRDKWHKNKDLALSETVREGSTIHDWILGRNGFGSGERFREYLADKRRVLDAGCGNGRVCLLLRLHSKAESTEIVGIDLVAASVAEENLAGQRGMRFETRDLLGDLSGLGAFDFIYCQEVLHHTQDPPRAFRNLCGLLAPGGELAVYVYKQKAPAREYVDDLVRGRIAALPYEQALDACARIAEFGRALSALDARVEVPEIEALEIPAGEYDVQRLFYHFFFKCFWSPDLSPHDNAVVNYDWYHPQTATRHTPEEVRGWFEENALKVVWEHVDFYGITMRGRRAGA